MVRCAIRRAIGSASYRAHRMKWALQFAFCSVLPAAVLTFHPSTKSLFLTFPQSLLPLCNVASAATVGEGVDNFIEGMKAALCLMVMLIIATAMNLTTSFAAWAVVYAIGALLIATYAHGILISKNLMLYFVGGMVVHYTTKTTYDYPLTLARDFVLGIAIATMTSIFPIPVYSYDMVFERAKEMGNVLARMMDAAFNAELAAHERSVYDALRNVYGDVRESVSYDLLWLWHEPVPWSHVEALLETLDKLQLAYEVIGVLVAGGVRNIDGPTLRNLQSLARQIVPSIEAECGSQSDPLGEINLLTDNPEGLLQLLQTALQPTVVAEENVISGRRLKYVVLAPWRFFVNTLRYTRSLVGENRYRIVYAVRLASLMVALCVAMLRIGAGDAVFGPAAMGFISWPNSVDTVESARLQLIGTGIGAMVGHLFIRTTTAPVALVAYAVLIALVSGIFRGGSRHGFVFFFLNFAAWAFLRPVLTDDAIATTLQSNTLCVCIYATAVLFVFPDRPDRAAVSSAAETFASMRQALEAPSEGFSNALDAFRGTLRRLELQMIHARRAARFPRFRPNYFPDLVLQSISEEQRAMAAVVCAIQTVNVATEESIESLRKMLTNLQEFVHTPSRAEACYVQLALSLNGMSRAVTAATHKYFVSLLERIDQLHIRNTLTFPLTINVAHTPYA